jgi:hypothetical protein
MSARAFASAPMRAAAWETLLLAELTALAH